MKILAFAGSNSLKSINKRLVTKVVSYFENDNSIEILDLNDYEMPIYSIDKEMATGVPELAIDFAKKIDVSDFLIISLAEYNGAYTAAFKNIFDWVSRVKGRKTFGDKPIFLMATSPGERGGVGILEIAAKRFPFNGGNVIQTFSLPKFADNFNDEEGVVNEHFRKELEDKVNYIKDTVLMRV